MITITNLVKTYNDKTVLNIDSLTLEDGLVYALLGANGSGKSTLLKLLGGIIKADGGVIEGIKNLKLGYSPQNSYGYNMSVLNNVLLATPNKKEYMQASNRILATFGMTELRGKNATELSGGETEKLALARILVVKRDVLLLDEPTASMDASAVSVAETTIKGYLKECNATLIFSTHSVEQAMRMADILLYIENGKVIKKEELARS